MTYKKMTLNTIGTKNDVLQRRTVVQSLYSLLKAEAAETRIMAGGICVDVYMGIWVWICLCVVMYTYICILYLIIVIPVESHHAIVTRFIGVLMMLKYRYIHIYVCMTARPSHPVMNLK